MYGYTWLYMAIHGNTKQYMAIHGYIWQYMATHGNTNQYMARCFHLRANSPEVAIRNFLGSVQSDGERWKEKYLAGTVFHILGM